MTNEVHIVELDPGFEQIRLDHFLSKKYPSISRAYLQKELIAKDKVKRVSGDVLRKKSTALFDGEHISVETFIHPEDREIVAVNDTSIELIEDNSDYCVFNKPKHMPTHPNSFEDASTLCNRFIALFPDAKNVGEDSLRPGVVHRLDSNTSGAIFFAKSNESYQRFRDKFNERQVYKLYVAAVIGKTPDSGRIDFDLAHDAKNKKRMLCIKKGSENYRSQLKPSQTAFKTIVQTEQFSLLIVKTFTGRMHQVRTHLSGIGFPLIGDKLYQSRQIQPYDLKKIDGHCLHALQLGYKINKKEEDSKNIFYSAAIPADLLHDFDRADLKIDWEEFLKDISQEKQTKASLLFSSIQEFLDFPLELNSKHEVQD